MLAQEMFGRLAQYVAAILPQNINTSLQQQQANSPTATDSCVDDSGIILSPTSDSVNTITGNDGLKPSATGNNVNAASSTAGSSSQAPVTDSQGDSSNVVDPFDVSGMTWILDEVEACSDKVEQLPRLLMPKLAHCLPSLKVRIIFS